MCGLDSNVLKEKKDVSVVQRKTTTTLKKITTLLLVIVSLYWVSITALATENKVDLVSMHELKSDNIKIIDGSNGGIKDSYGNYYAENIVRFYTGNDAFITYDLNGQYESFDGEIVCSESTNREAVISVGIYADGVKVYELKNYTKQKAAEVFHINVNGVGELSIKTTQTKGSSGDVYFVDGSFTKVNTVQPFPKRFELNDLVVIDSLNSKVSNRLLVDVFGDVHNGWIRIGSTRRQSGYVLFNLDKQYVSLSGKIVTTDQTAKDEKTNIEFYLDDKLVYSKTGIVRTSKATDFEIDVSNASVLKVVTSSTNTYKDYVFVADAILKMHEHTPSDWCVKVEATCTEKGEMIQKCSGCGDIIYAKVIEATGHDVSGIWENPEDGTCNKVQKCTVCGEVAKRQADTEVEHSLGGEWSVVRESSCDVEGERGRYCTVCNKIGLTEAIPKVEHNYGKWTTVSGSIWNNPIVKERICIDCGNAEQMENNSTSWVKTLVLVLLFIILSSVIFVIVTFKIKGKGLDFVNTKNLFLKNPISDKESEEMYRMPEDATDSN